MSSTPALDLGPAPRDLTPEATEAACTRMMPGFGEPRGHRQ